MQATTQNTALPLQQIYQLVAKYSIEQQFIIAEYIKKQALIAKWDQFAQTICRDNKDNYLLALAKDSKANFLLTGDNDLLVLKQFENTQIMKLSSYLFI